MTKRSTSCLSICCVIPRRRPSGSKRIPQLKKFIADIVAPRLAELTGSAGAIDAMGNLIWRLGDASASEGLLLMGYAMTFPAASMKQPFSGAFVDGEPFGMRRAVRSRSRRMRTKGRAGGNDLRGRDRSAGAIKLARAANSGGELGGRDRPSRRGKIYFGKRCASARTLPSSVWERAIESASATRAGSTSKSSCAVSRRTAACPKRGVNAVDGFRRVMERLDRLPLEAGHRGSRQRHLDGDASHAADRT